MKCGGQPEDIFCRSYYGLRAGPLVLIRCKNCGYEVNNDSFQELSAIRASAVMRMAEIVISRWNGEKFTYRR